MKIKTIALATALAAIGAMASAEEVRVYNWSDYIDEDLLAEWFTEAGLRRVVSSRLPGSPFPVVLCLARRLAQDEEAAA